MSGKTSLAQFDRDLANSKEYKKIIEIIKRLFADGVIQKGTGFCLSMSEMMKLLLKQNSIECELIECKLTVINNNPPQLSLIGHDGIKMRMLSDDVDTHVVVITKGEIPLLIDTSIFGLRRNVDFICEKIINDLTDPSIIGEYELSGAKWIYQKKEITRLPFLNQIGHLARLNLDREFSNKISLLTMFVYGLSFITFFNLVLNTLILILND